jgi:hypothetical protein
MWSFVQTIGVCNKFRVEFPDKVIPSPHCTSGNKHCKLSDIFKTLFAYIFGFPTHFLKIVFSCRLSVA